MLKTKMSREFAKTQELLNLRTPCDTRCYTARTITKKDEKGKQIIEQVPCTKMVEVNSVSKCALYLSPVSMWRNGQCVFPNSTAQTRKDDDIRSLRKFGRR